MGKIYGVSWQFSLTSKCPDSYVIRFENENEFGLSKGQSSPEGKDTQKGNPT